MGNLFQKQISKKSFLNTCSVRAFCFQLPIQVPIGRTISLANVVANEAAHTSEIIFYYD